MVKPLFRLAFALVIAVSLTGCGVGGSADWGCTERDEGLATDLAELSVLDQRPEGAKTVDQYSGCDLEDGFAYAGRQYRSDLDREKIMTFYRTAAPKEVNIHVL